MIANMKRFLLLLIAVMPMVAQAQNFTPDLPEERGIYLFMAPAMNAPHSDWLVMSGETLTAVEVKSNGWVKLSYTDKKGQELTGYNKIKMLKPLDDVAAGMKETAVRRAALEIQIIRWGIILVAIGLVIAFMPFLGKARTWLLYAILLAVGGLELWFLSTGGFTFYSPAVVGWKWAVVWFVGLIVFLAAQAIVWYKAIFSIVRTPEVVGNAMLIPSLAAIVLVVGYVLSLFWVGLETWFDKGFVIAVALSAVYLFINAAIKDGIVEAAILTPLYVVGVTAIAWMLRDVVIVFIGLMFLGNFLKTSFVSKGNVLDHMAGRTYLGTDSQGDDVWEVKR
jgi:hypothetical protein